MPGKKERPMIELRPRFFILPLVALIVIGSLPAAGDSGPAAQNSGCGSALTSFTDLGMRATFEEFQRRQSAAAAKICAVYRNMEPIAR
jgi:hypothetical protein